MNPILSRLGLSKEQVAKLLKTPFKESSTSPLQIPDKNPGVRRWKRVPDDVKKAIQQEHTSISYKELAEKYNVSKSIAYTIRTGKVYKHKHPKSH